MKLCKKCNVEQPTTNFHKNGKYLYSVCKTCKKAYNQTDAVKKYQKKWYQDNIERQSQLYQENSAERKLRQKEWYKKNRKQALEARKKYVQLNRGKINALCAKRRAIKLQRTPSWADLEAIKKFYENCPKGYHVDHIIPLQGKIVSGLHVLSNLQYLTAEENLKKSNTYNIEEGV